MYHPHGFQSLDTPPPPSRFRRPWSPDPEDPASAGPGIREERREPSDVSVEALDLADYARTLRQHTHNQQDDPLDSYPYAIPPFRAYDNYPPTPPPIHRALASRESLPSLASPSASSVQSHASTSRTPPIPHRRPFSLPPPSSYPHHYNNLQNHPSVSSRTNSTPRHSVEGYESEPHIQQPEIDIGNFPAFTRGWYRQKQDDPFITPPYRGAPNNGLFDPANPIDAYRYDTYGYGNYSPPSDPRLSSYNNHQPSRDADLLPWGVDQQENGAPVDPEIKEERIKMLEHEFGKKGKGKAVDEEKRVGSVDSKGNLITEGPKKRLATRWMQVILAALAGGSSIYVAVAIKLPKPAPPSGTVAAYLLYLLSVLTFLGCTYFFLLYPCCCGPRKSKPLTEGPAGMMVLPVQGLPGGKKDKKNKKKGGGGSDGVQVNLIVDPGMFGNQGDEEDEDEDEYGSEYGLPGSFGGSSSGRSSGKNGKRKNRKRRGVFEGLALEASWKRARKLLKIGMAVDLLLLVLWGAEFVVILIGKRCPVGQFNGWCTGYNTATAAAAFLTLAFGLSVFFDIKDLSASSASPRTRT